jgi:hypothetical protein
MAYSRSVFTSLAKKTELKLPSPIIFPKMKSSGVARGRSCDPRVALGRSLDPPRDEAILRTASRKKLLKYFFALSFQRKFNSNLEKL